MFTMQLLQRLISNFAAICTILICGVLAQDSDVISLCFLKSILAFSAGDSQPMDVCSVHSEDRFLRYSVSLLGYGFYGDVLTDSERKRWMGPARYDISGTHLRFFGGVLVSAIFDGNLFYFFYYYMYLFIYFLQVLKLFCHIATMKELCPSYLLKGTWELPETKCSAELGKCCSVCLFTFTFMHLADGFIQSDSAILHLYIIIHFFHYVCSLGIEPTTFALLTQCSNAML